MQAVKAREVELSTREAACAKSFAALQAGHVDVEKSLQELARKQVEIQQGYADLEARKEVCSTPSLCSVIVT